MRAGTSELLHPGDPAEGAGHEAVFSPPIRPVEIHKSHAANVWIHDPVEESAFSLSTGFEVPAGIREPRFVDLIEVQRQSGILQAHRQLGVRDGVVFTLDQIALKLVTGAPSSVVPRDRGRIRTQIVAAASRGRARSLAQHFTLESPFGLLAVGTARTTLIPRGVYDRVRESARVSTSLKTPSGRKGFRYEGPLRIDASDPLLSDHPSDHLTAIQAIADIERVALEGRANAGIRALKLTFQRYADAEPTPTLRLDVSSAGKLVAEVVQLGVRRARVTGTLTASEQER